MIGPYVTDEDKKRYKERSPIHYVDKMQCSLALFQGDEDQVMKVEVYESLGRN